jgi:hypothetical protein
LHEFVNYALLVKNNNCGNNNKKRNDTRSVAKSIG